MTGRRPFAFVAKQQKQTVKQTGAERETGRHEVGRQELCFRGGMAAGGGGVAWEAGGRHDRGALWSVTTERSDHLVGVCCLFVSSVKSLGWKNRKISVDRNSFLGNNSEFKVDQVNETVSEDVHLR